MKFDLKESDMNKNIVELSDKLKKVFGIFGFEFEPKDIHLDKMYETLDVINKKR